MHLPLVIVAYPRLVLAGSVVLLGVGATDLGLAAVVAEDAGQYLALGVLTSIGGIVASVSGLLTALAKIRADERGRDMARHERDLARQQAMAEADMARKERMHDFNGKLNLYALQIESLRQDVHEREARLADAIRTIEDHRRWINAFVDRHPHESGEIPTVKPG